jgi:hypothetical protein
MFPNSLLKTRLSRESCPDAVATRDSCSIHNQPKLVGIVCSCVFVLQGCPTDAFIGDAFIIAALGCPRRCVPTPAGSDSSRFRLQPRSDSCHVPIPATERASNERRRFWPSFQFFGKEPNEPNRRSKEHGLRSISNPRVDSEEEKLRTQESDQLLRRSKTWSRVRNHSLLADPARSPKLTRNCNPWGKLGQIPFPSSGQPPTNPQKDEFEQLSRPSALDPSPTCGGFAR